MLQDDVYLSKEEEAIGVNSDMLASNQIEIVSYDYIVIADDLGESRAVNIEFLVKGSVRVVSKEVIDVIKDAYSPTKSVLLTKKKYNIGLIQGIVPSELIIKDNLYPKNEDEKISSVVFTSVVDLKGTKPDMNAICNVHLENIDGTVEANTIGIRATLSIATKVCYKVEKEWIVDIEESEEEKQCKKSSVTIYVVNVGDTLWELAKKYNTTMDSLIKINELEGSESLTVGKKIIIPGKCKF